MFSHKAQGSSAHRNVALLEGGAAEGLPQFSEACRNTSGIASEGSAPLRISHTQPGNYVLFLVRDLTEALRQILENEATCEVACVYFFY